MALFHKTAKDSKLNKMISIIMAVAFALLLWVYVVNVENPSGSITIHSVPVQIQGEAQLEEHGLMVSELSQTEINLRITGKKKTLMRITAQNTTVTVDVSSITSEGVWNVAGKIIFPSYTSDDSISVSNWDSLQVEVTVQGLDQKDIPVVGEYIGTEAPHYQTGNVSVSDETVTIRGSAQSLASVNYALAQVSGENVSKSFSQEADLIFMQDDGTPIHSSAISSSINSVTVSVPVAEVDVIPITVTLKEGGGASPEDIDYTIIPDSITVRSDSIPDGLTSISLGTIDLANTFTDSIIRMPIELPEGTVQWGSSATSAAVSLTSDKVQIRSYKLTNLVLENVPDAVSVQLIDDTLNVWIRGPVYTLNQLRESEITAVLDLSKADLTAVGPQRLRVSFEMPRNYSDKVGIVGTNYRAAVVLNR